MESIVYTAADIMLMLGISKNTTYKLLNEAYISKKPFPVIKIGKDFRVPKKHFDAWIENMINEA